MSNEWEIGGDQANPKLPEFAEVLAKYNKDHDGRLSPTKSPPAFPIIFSATTI
jgi:hypothetical protein